LRLRLAVAFFVAAAARYQLERRPMTLRTRELALGKPDLKSRTVPVTLSTDTPVDRGDYLEVLDHSPASIDLSRAPLPLIESHDASGLPIGVVDQLRTDGRKLRGVARFGNSQRAQAVLQDVQDGILRSVSVGYEYTGPPVAQGDGKTLRFPFKPLEVSAVSVPADPNAGFFRSYPTMNLNEDNNTPLSRSARRALNAEEENQRSAVEMERARIAEIEALCVTHKVPSETKRDMIQRGMPVDEVRGIILDHLIAQGERQKRREMDLQQTAEFGFSLDFSASDRNRYSLSRAILAAASHDWAGAGLEREASRAIAKRIGRDTAGVFIPLEMLVPQRRDYNTLTGAAGGSLVATNLLGGNFIDLLRSKCRVMQLGATVLSGLVGNVDIPRRTAAGAAQWITEGQALTASAGAFDVVSLRPKTVGSIGVLSRNLLMQGTPDAEMLVRGDMVQQIAIAIDSAAIAGTGAAAQPLGLLNMAGVSLVNGGANGAPVDFDRLIELSTVVAAANADSGALGFLSNPAVLGALSRLKSTTGEYLWAGRGGINENSAPAAAVPGSTASGDAGFSILGYRAAFSNNVPSNLTKGTSTSVCSAVIFGNWSDLLIGEWGVLEILPNPYASGAYEAGAVQIRAMQTIDVAVRHAESFAVMKDALTA
jgi:HK97 family phage major capsid protein